jgi:Trk K+ transport system NAD-binding subunit
VRQSVTLWYLTYIKRPTLAFFRMRGARSFGILLLIFAIIVVGSFVDLYANYTDPETGRGLDPGAAAYAVFALLVFETPLPLPDSWLTRLAFFAVPISGIFVLGQGIIRIGSTLLDRDAWNKAMASTYEDHTIVCGLGKVSLRVIRWILDLNEEVIVIESRRTNPLIEEVRSWGVPVMIGDAHRPEVLEEAGVRQAESIVPCTSDDLTNLGIALEARKLAPGLKVVLRMVDTRMAANVREGFDIHTAFSIPEISAPAFAAAATRAPLDHAIAFGEGQERSLLTITKFTLVPESVLVGYTIRQLEDEFEVAVIARRHQGRFMLHPHDDVVLEADDRFVVSASIEALNTIARLTPPTREYDTYLKGNWPIKTTT